MKYIAEHSQPKDFQLIQQVVLSDGRQLPFQMIVSGVPGSARDVAVIKTNVKNAPTLKLMDYNDIASFSMVHRTIAKVLSGTVQVLAWYTVPLQRY